jgi:hypothetical protein
MADYTSYELGNILKRLEKRVDAALCCCESLELKNLGLGVPIYVGRFKNYLKIRSLVAGTNMNITYDSNTITFDSLAGGFSCSDLNSCSTSNLPEGSNLYYTDARVLSYMTGQNISIFTNDSGYITAASLPTVGTWGALNYPTWVSGTPFVKMTAAGTFALDTNTYLTTAVTSVGTTGLISGGPITTTGTITTSMNTNKLVGRSTAGTGIMEEITVGTGLSLSAGTLTASGTASPLTTKGDLYTYSTIDARLPVGLDTQILLADSSTTTGLKWGTNTAATPLGYYGAWQTDTTQTAAASNVGYPMRFEIADITPNGISIVNNGSGDPTRITFANTGIYNIQFSSQFQNIDNAEHDVTIWLRLSGTDVTGSAGFIQVPKRKAAGVGNEGHVIVSWNYVLSVVAGQYYELVWSTTSHTNVTMEFYAAGSPPPSAASVIMTVTQQSGIMAGTGITAINSLTGSSQTMVAGTSGTDFAVSSVGTTHTLNLPTASATNRGALSTTDWSAFNGKLSTTLTNGNVFVGNVSNVATSVAMSGDATIINTGAITIANNAVTDAKLRQSAGLSLVGRSTNSTGNVADITASTANSALRLNAAGTALAFSTAPLSVLISNHNTTAVLSSTNYIQITGAATAVAAASIASRQTAFPIASTAQNMYVKTNASQSATGSLVISLTIGATPSALSVTIAAGSAIGTFSNTSSTVTVAAGNLLTYEIKNNATATSASVITISTCFY